MVVVVVVVVLMQQNPTISGASCTSPRRHASRILTHVLNVPSSRGLAHRTAAFASDTLTAISAASTANVLIIAHLPAAEGISLSYGLSTWKGGTSPSVV